MGKGKQKRGSKKKSKESKKLKAQEQAAKRQHQGSEQEEEQLQQQLPQQQFSDYCLSPPPATPTASCWAMGCIKTSPRKRDKPEPSRTAIQEEPIELGALEEPSSPVSRPISVASTSSLESPGRKRRSRIQDRLDSPEPKSLQVTIDSYSKMRITHGKLPKTCSGFLAPEWPEDYDTVMKAEEEKALKSSPSLSSFSKMEQEPGCSGAGSSAPPSTNYGTLDSQSSWSRGYRSEQRSTDSISPTSTRHSAYYSTIDSRTTWSRGSSEIAYLPYSQSEYVEETCEGDVYEMLHGPKVPKRLEHRASNEELERDQEATTSRVRRIRSANFDTNTLNDAESLHEHDRIPSIIIEPERPSAPENLPPDEEEEEEEPIPGPSGESQAKKSFPVTVLLATPEKRARAQAARKASDFAIQYVDPSLRDLSELLGFQIPDKSIEDSPVRRRASAPNPIHLAGLQKFDIAPQTVKREDEEDAEQKKEAPLAGDNEQKIKEKIKKDRGKALQKAESKLKERKRTEEELVDKRSERKKVEGEKADTAKASVETKFKQQARKEEGTVFVFPDNNNGEKKVEKKKTDREEATKVTKLERQVRKDVGTVFVFPDTTNKEKKVEEKKAEKKEAVKEKKPEQQRKKEAETATPDKKDGKKRAEGKKADKKKAAKGSEFEQQRKKETGTVSRDYECGQECASTSKVEKIEKTKKHKKKSSKATKPEIEEEKKSPIEQPDNNNGEMIPVRALEDTAVKKKEPKEEESEIPPADYIDPLKTGTRRKEKPSGSGDQQESKLQIVEPERRYRVRSHSDISEESDATRRTPSESVEIVTAVIHPQPSTSQAETPGTSTAHSKAALRRYRPENQGRLPPAGRHNPHRRSTGGITRDEEREARLAAGEIEDYIEIRSASALEAQQQVLSYGVFRGSESGLIIGSGSLLDPKGSTSTLDYNTTKTDEGAYKYQNIRDMIGEIIKERKLKVAPDIVRGFGYGLWEALSKIVDALVERSSSPTPSSCSSSDYPPSGASPCPDKINVTVADLVEYVEEPEFPINDEVLRHYFRDVALKYLAIEKMSAAARGPKPEGPLPGKDEDEEKPEEEDK